MQFYGHLIFKANISTIEILHTTFCSNSYLPIFYTKSEQAGALHEVKV